MVEALVVRNMAVRVYGISFISNDGLVNSRHPLLGYGLSMDSTAHIVAICMSILAKLFPRRWHN